MSDFSDTDDIGEEIEVYRRRRDQRERLGNFLIAFLAVLAAVAGIVLIVVWMGGGSFSIPGVFPANTETPTPTLTFTPSQTVTMTFTSTFVTPTITPTQGQREYIVQEGDYLAKIAEKFNTTVQAIIDYNLLYNTNLTDADRKNLLDGIIYAGQKLLIPPEGWTVSPTPFPANLKPGTRILITVEPGDTLQSIANRCLSTVDSILKDPDNRKNYPSLKTDPNNIQVGWRLWCTYGIATPVPTRSVPTEGPTPTDTLIPSPQPTSTRSE